VPALFSGTLTTIAAERNSAGLIEAFGVDDAGKVFHRWQLSPNSDSWSAWVDFGGPGTLSNAPSAISVTRMASGGLGVFGVNSGGQIFRRVEFALVNGSNGGTWSDWVSVDGTLTTITAQTNGNGQIELFGMNGGGQMYHRWELAPGTGNWSGWISLGSPIPVFTLLPVSTIAATTTGAGGLEVYATNNAGQIFRNAQFTLPSGSSQGTWSNWVGNDGTLSAIAADTNADGRIELVGAQGSAALIGVPGSGAVYARQQTAPYGQGFTPSIGGGRPAPQVGLTECWCRDRTVCS
jgi:hypothetical protein